jgi:hypothetical protein
MTDISTVSAQQICQGETTMLKSSALEFLGVDRQIQRSGAPYAEERRIKEAADKARERISTAFARPGEVRVYAKLVKER